jgi:hypothetical protein
MVTRFTRPVELDHRSLSSSQEHFCEKGPAVCYESYRWVAKLAFHILRLNSVPI